MSQDSPTITDKIARLLLCADDAPPAFIPDELLTDLADVVYRLCRAGSIIDWTLTPAGLSITLDAVARRHLQEQLATPTIAQQPPLCEYCHTRHYGYQDHYLA